MSSVHCAYAWNRYGVVVDIGSVFSRITRNSDVRTTSSDGKLYIIGQIAFCVERRIAMKLKL